MKSVKVLLLIYFTVCAVLQDVNCRDFAYNGAMGPKHWGEQYSTCSGKYQSPINIDEKTLELRTYPELNGTNFETKPVHAELRNNGHTVVMHMEFADGKRPTIKNGPLRGTFVFTQLHFHWGENDTIGSEDRINNMAFPAELHLVFYNQDYKNFDEAVVEDNGIAVMAFFFEVNKKDNPNYTDFTNLLEDVIRPNTVATFPDPPSLNMLIFPIDYLDLYMTYIGSLTTPPCSEDVTWLDYDSPISISPRQIEKFRRLYTYDNQPLTHNFRPLQPLNNRTIYVPKRTNPNSMGGIPFVDNLVDNAGAVKPITIVLISALLCGFGMSRFGATIAIISN